MSFSSSTRSPSRFASTAASGENWRDIGRKILEELESYKTEGFKPNLGFLYMTDALAADAASIVTLFRSITGIEHWSGCAGKGICANGIEYFDVPALSVLVGQVDTDLFRPFYAAGPDFKKLHRDLEPWLNKHDPMLMVSHIVSSSGIGPLNAIEEIDAMVGGYMVGGFESSSDERIIISHEVKKEGIGGIVFSQEMPVAVSQSQGCVPIGPLHELSKADDGVIAYLDGRIAFDVFSEDMTNMAQQRLGYNPGEQLLKTGALSAEASTLIKGQAHIAFPVIGSDKNDFQVKNILAVDPDTGLMAVPGIVEDGQKIFFVHRDDQSVRSDLSATLVALRRRVEREHGRFAPKAALYISCISRANVPFIDQSGGGEMALVKDVLGDIPLAGFYANGEISNNRLYGHTSVIVLFL